MSEIPDLTAVPTRKGGPTIDLTGVTWREAVGDGRLNFRAVWKAEPLRTSCPTCEVTGPKVYVAAEHTLGTSCKWMMANLHRCAEHDELLLPSEDGCPLPQVPDHWQDPHNRFTGRQP